MNKYPSIKNIFKVNNNGKYNYDEMDKYAELILYSRVSAFEKIDGMNIRVIYKDGNLDFRGRTDKAQLPKKLVDKLHTMFDDKLVWFRENFPEGVTLYGEGIGPKIQGNKYKLTNYDFILFDVLYKEDDKWYWADKNKVVNNIAESLQIKSTKKIYDNKVLFHIIDYHVGDNNQTPKSAINQDVDIEGFVIVPVLPLYDSKYNRVIFKLKFKYIYNNPSW